MLFLIGLLGCGLVACTPTADVPLPTAVAIVKPLATAVVSPTPNPEQISATRLAASPTPLPSTPTPIPSPTAYVGVFIGQAEQALGFQAFTQPLFAPDIVGLEPTADARRCGRPIDGRYLAVWRTNRIVNERLGCPIQEAFGFFGKLQVFEQGVMYYQPDIRAVWAVLPQGNSGRFFYLESPPPLSAPITAPNDSLIAPSGDFGSLWSLVPELSARMGFGITPEQDVALAIQRFDSGTFLLDASSGQAFALVVDGTAYGPFAVTVNSEITITPTAITIDAP
jgi:hypothetical protein